MKKRNCVVCGHPVGSGGNRHANGRCPAKAKGDRASRRHHWAASQELAIPVDPNLPARGMPVPGTGKPGPGEKA